MKQRPNKVLAVLRKVLIFPFIALIRFYQVCISPLTPAACRFTPTCSQYALDAVREFGIIFGLSLTVWRILRCNPFCKGGYDPVPDTGFKSFSKCRETDCETHTDTTEKEKEN